MNDYIINIAVILQLFVLINPLSSFPFLMMAHKKKLNVKKIAVHATLVAFIIALIVAFTGQFLFNLYGITLDSFRVAGGIILLLLGIDTIRPKQSKKKDVSGVHGLISIIATPMLTGPAVISYVTIKTYEIGRIHLILNMVIAFIMVFLIFFIFALSINKINEKIINIVSRILGLFLTSVAIEMIAKGIQGLILGKI